MWYRTKSLASRQSVICQDPNEPPLLGIGEIEAITISVTHQVPQDDEKGIIAISLRAKPYSFRSSIEHFLEELSRKFHDDFIEGSLRWTGEMGICKFHRPGPATEKGVDSVTRTICGYLTRGIPTS